MQMLVSRCTPGLLMWVYTTNQLCRRSIGFPLSTLVQSTPPTLRRPQLIHLLDPLFEFLILALLVRMAFVLSVSSKVSLGPLFFKTTASGGGSSNGQCLHTWHFQGK
jgi:hypothetical protein